MTLPEIIHSMRDKYIERGTASYAHINDGQCSDISWEIADNYPKYANFIVTNTQFMDGEDDQEPTMWNTELLKEVNSLPPIPVEQLNKIHFSHVWIIYKGKHYDAEAPDGVSSLWKLPYFQRKISKAVISEMIVEKAAGLILINGREILLCKRAMGINQPGTWSYPGGKANDGEDLKKAAVRELREETKYTGGFMLMKHLATYKEEAFQYETFVAFIKDKFKPQLDWENTASGWFTLDHLPKPLHSGLIHVLPQLKQFMEQRNESKGSWTSRLLRRIIQRV